MKSTSFFLVFPLMVLLFTTGCKKDSTDDEIQYTVTTVPLRMLGYSSVPSAVIGQPFVRQLPAQGGKPPYTWSLISGSLPPGLSVASNGRVTGTPTATGEYNYTLQLKDSKGTKVTNSYTQKIATTGTITFMLLTPEIPAYGEDQDVGYQFFVQGGALPWTFVISGLPEGVTFDPDNGVIYGTPTAASATTISIRVFDANGNEAAGSPVSAAFAVNAPVPTGGGGGGGGGGVIGCPSMYDGNYIGSFKYVYYVKGSDGNYSPVDGGLQVTLTLKCLATAGGSTVLTITHAVCSDANFGCQLGGCTPVTPSVATLPASPPANSSNPSTAGQGILVFFPNGATLGTANGTGALNVSSDGRTLSNSLDPNIQNSTWVAQGGSFPSSSVPPGGPVTQFKSWILTKSATK